MMNFKELETTKKGTVGEKIIFDLLMARDYVIYSPEEDKAHLVDYFAYRSDVGLRAVEIKSYPRRAFHDDTGIDAADFKKYGRLCNPLLLFFCDPFERMIYFQEFETIAPHAHFADGKAYFPLYLFVKVRELTSEEARRIGAGVDWALYKYTKRFFQ